MTHTAMSDAIEILMVDDNPGDVRLTQEALRVGQLRNHMSVVEDGDDALEFLRREGAYADVRRPDLILLDLNLPKKDGRQVLAEVKGDETLRRIPVVILSTSRAEEDVVGAYDRHANCYVSKPMDLDDFITVVHRIEGFWFETVRLSPE